MSSSTLDIPAFSRFPTILSEANKNLKKFTPRINNNKNFILQHTLTYNIYREALV